MHSIPDAIEHSANDTVRCSEHDLVRPANSHARGSSSDTSAQAHTCASTRRRSRDLFLCFRFVARTDVAPGSPTEASTWIPRCLCCFSLRRSSLLLQFCLCVTSSKCEGSKQRLLLHVWSTCLPGGTGPSCILKLTRCTAIVPPSIETRPYSRPVFPSFGGPDVGPSQSRHPTVKPASGEQRSDRANNFFHRSRRRLDTFIVVLTHEKMTQQQMANNNDAT